VNIHIYQPSSEGRELSHPGYYSKRDCSVKVVASGSLGGFRSAVYARETWKNKHQTPEVNMHTD